MTLNSVSTSQGFVAQGTSSGTITVNLGTITAGSSAKVTFVIQTNAGSVGSITDTATVTSLEPDPNPDDESAAVTTTVCDRRGPGRLARRESGPGPRGKRPDLHDHRE